jgi:uncharacterized protein YfaS (alpha-2-macroglobulin family)
VLDDLIIYPYGCLEQTASRLIPLAIAYRLTDEAALRDQLRSALLTHRVRLIQMANMDGSFGWWGDQTQGTTLLSSYAYFADWFTTQAMGLTLPPGQGDALLAIYQQKAAQEPVLHRQLALWWMAQMGLPVDTLQQGVDEALLAQLQQQPVPQIPAQQLPDSASASAASQESVATAPSASQPTDAAQTKTTQAANVSSAQPTTVSAATSATIAKPDTRADASIGSSTATASQLTSWSQDGVIMSQPDSDTGLALALLLNQQLHQQRSTPLPAPLASRVKAWQPWIQASQDPLLQLLRHGKAAATLSASELDALLARITPQSPTLERALLLSLLQSRLTATPSAAASVAPVGPWLARRLPSGAMEWQWQGQGLPTHLSFQGQPAAGTQLLVRYESGEQPGGGEQQEASLPIQLQRTLYRLDPLSDGSGFTAVALTPDETLQSNALYVDEVILTPKENEHFRYGMLEVALPPGADVEPSTWGIQIAGLDGNQTPVSFSRAQFETGSLSYRVPVPELNAPLTVRQLLRFAERGRFNLPASRYFSMYQPANKALTDAGKPVQWRVE